MDHVITVGDVLIASGVSIFVVFGLFLLGYVAWLNDWWWF